MIHLATGPLRQQGAAPPGAPDLIAGMGWAHAYWAKGPEFLALGLADGAAVATWPDEVGSIDYAQATGAAQPAFDQVDAAFNNESSLVLAAGDYMDVPSTLGSLIGCVWIAKLTSAAATNRWCDNHISGGRWVLGTFGANWQLYYGGSAAQATPADTNLHLGVNYQNAALDYLRVDGGTIYSGTDRGSSTIQRFRIGNGGSHIGVRLAFMGFHAGDPEADAGWTDFVDAAETLYGITTSY